MLRVGLHQGEHGSGLSPQDIQFYRQAGIHLLALPEYYWVRPEDVTHIQAASHAPEDLEFLKALSRQEQWVIAGGTLVEALEGGAWRNAAPLLWEGKEIGRYHKRRLMPGEKQNGALPGERWVAWNVGDLRIAPIVCADVFLPHAYDEVAALNPDVVVAPMASPYLPDDSIEKKEERDLRYFVRGAQKLKGYVLKVAGTGNLFGRPLQGRCLVAGPEGILFRTPYDQERVSKRWIVDLPIHTAYFPRPKPKTVS